jgi:uncharacterized FAD-dependent dehydrogenase
MHKEIQLSLSPEKAEKKENIEKQITETLKISPVQITRLRILHKSVDARSYLPKINLTVEVYWDENPPEKEKASFHYHNVGNKPSVLIIGSGPAGLFAALKLIELGLKPIILERGKEIGQRKIDIATLNRNKGVNPDSNYCFGEGGAGTFSDGKLYTRSKKKGNVQHILEVFHFHGADENILYEAHPHIGSDKLPTIVENICQTIRDCSGEIHYGEKMTEILIDNGKVKGCKTSNGNIFDARAIILATGHSAHDIYQMLYDQNILLENKGFAMGVRVEHPQELIDSIQYHRKNRGEYLPPATYQLVEQIDGRGVYSFCMCPGGHIVPAVSRDKEIVVNGMSPSKRNSPFANSGIVVETRPEDIPVDFQQFGALSGLKYQQYIENLAYINNGNLGLTAPSQRLSDFVKGKLSADLPSASYLPGLISSPLHFWLPSNLSKRLQEGFKKFDKKMHGFLTNEAIVVGVESRSSSPVRIPREHDTFQHPQLKGLFPCGEGSGYAGGITSSAIDGENVAVAVFESKLCKK